MSYNYNEDNKDWKIGLSIIALVIVYCFFTVYGLTHKAIVLTRVVDDHQGVVARKYHLHYEEGWHTYEETIYETHDHCERVPGPVNRELPVPNELGLCRLFITGTADTKYHLIVAQEVVRQERVQRLRSQSLQ